MKDAPIEFHDPAWAILRSLPTLLSYWDRDLKCRFANHAHEIAFGRKASRMVDLSLEAFFGPALFARRQPEIQGVLRGEPQEFSRELPDADGTLRAGLVNFLPHVVHGKVVGFITQVTDVTRLHDMQSALEAVFAEKEHTLRVLSRSEAQLRQAEELGQIGSWTLDVASGAVTWSPQLYVVAGVDPADAAPLLQDQSTLFTPESWERIQQAVDRAANHGEPYVIEVELINRNNAHRAWLELRGAAVRDGTGTIATLHGTAQVVSSRRRAGEAVTGARRIADLEAELAAVEARIGTLTQALAAR